MTESMLRLKRVLGFWPAYGAAVGLVISGTAMVSVGNVAGIAGKASFITALIALIPMMAAAFAYGELTAMLPGGGMVSDYTMPALGRFWAIFAVLSGYLMLIAADGGTQQVIGGLSIERLTGLPQYIGSFALLALVFVVNINGVKIYGSLEAALTLIMLVLFLAIGLMGVTGGGDVLGAAQKVVDQSVLPQDKGGIFTAVGIAIWWFIGFEFACPMAEENKKPHRNIPRALILGLISIYIVDVIFAWAASAYTPKDILLNSSIPHVEAAKRMMGNAGFYVMTAVTIIAAFTTANAEMAALPRMLYGMARKGLMPKVFARLHPRTRVPWVGVVFTALLMCGTVVYVTAKGADIDVILSLILTAAITWMVSYAIAMVDVLVLRRKYPDFVRLWKAPYASITMPLGLLGVAFAISTIYDMLLGALSFMVIVAIVTYSWLKYKNLDPFTPIPIEDSAREILERSEPEEEWDSAVTAWLASRTGNK